MSFATHHPPFNLVLRISGFDDRSETEHFVASKRAHWTAVQGLKQSKIDEENRRMQQRLVNTQPYVIQQYSPKRRIKMQQGSAPRSAYAASYHIAPHSMDDENSSSRRSTSRPSSAYTSSSTPSYSRAQSRAQSAHRSRRTSDGIPPMQTYASPYNSIRPRTINVPSRPSSSVRPSPSPSSVGDEYHRREYFDYPRPATHTNRYQEEKEQFPADEDFDLETLAKATHIQQQHEMRRPTPPMHNPSQPYSHPTHPQHSPMPSPPTRPLLSEQLLQQSFFKQRGHQRSPSHHRMRAFRAIPSPVTSPTVTPSTEPKLDAQRPPIPPIVVTDNHTPNDSPLTPSHPLQPQQPPHAQPRHRVMPSESEAHHFFQQHRAETTTQPSPTHSSHTNPAHHHHHRPTQSFSYGELSYSPYQHMMNGAQHHDGMPSIQELSRSNMHHRQESIDEDAYLEGGLWMIPHSHRSPMSSSQCTTACDCNGTFSNGARRYSSRNAEFIMHVSKEQQRAAAAKQHAVTNQRATGLATSPYYNAHLHYQPRSGMPPFLPPSLSSTSTCHTHTKISYSRRIERSSDLHR